MRETVMIIKIGSLMRHYSTKHKASYEQTYLLKSKLRGQEIKNSLYGNES